MKLPRWLVISLLSISTLSVLAFAGWWWVTWPERQYLIRVLTRNSSMAQQSESSGGRGCAGRWRSFLVAAAELLAEVVKLDLRATAVAVVVKLGLFGGKLFLIRIESGTFPFSTDPASAR